MAQNGRILYFNRDNPLPSGGVRAIYAHVGHLVRNGFAAYVVQGRPDFKPAWFTSSVPTLYHEGGLSVGPDDTAIIPEDYYSVLNSLASTAVRKLVFCQNHFYIFQNPPEGRSWKELGISGVFAGSQVIADFVRSALGWPAVPVVHCAIDHAVFKPAPKKLQIAYMPRKCKASANFIRGVCSSLGGPLAGMNWIGIDQMAESRVAEILGESAMFLSLSRLEGFGLPPIEAMACGCVVVGYHGYGGVEYASSENGFWCEEGNPMACVEAIRAAVGLLIGNDPRIAAMTQNAIATAARYNFERQEADLLDYIRSVTAPGSPRF